MVQSQETANSDSLTALNVLLSQLSEKYYVNFSYVDELISGKEIQLNYDSGKSFSDVIAELQEKTRLRFERVGAEDILIRPYNKYDEVSICGYVISADGSPLMGVTVSYSDAEGTYTDENGFFVLDSIPYGSSVIFRSVGFLTEQHHTSRLPFDQCARIQMGESVGMLDEVVVKDYLASGISKSGNTIVVAPKEFKTLAGLVEPDIMQSIQQSPGVNSPFETAAGLYVRGGLPDQNLILWNGIKTYNQGHFFGMISAFNPYITEEVSFVKNGTSAKYGGRVSSVIDIKTKQSVADEISGGAGTNLLYGDAYLNIPILKNKLSTQFSARRSFTDFAETVTYGQMADRVFQNTKIEESSTNDQANNTFYFNDFTANISWKIDDNNLLKFNSLYSEDDLNFSTSDDQDRTYNDLLFHANEGYILDWDHTNDRFSVNVSTSYSKYILKYEFITAFADTSEISSKKNLVEDFDFQLNSAYRLSENGRLIFGYQFLKNNIQYAYETRAPTYLLVLDSDNTTLNTHSAYAEYQYSSKKFLVKPGLRFNRYDELNRSFLEPRLSAEFFISDHWSINGSGEYRTQVASQIKESVVSDLSLENKVWALASDGRFPIIKSYQITLGPSFEKRGWLVDLEAYQKQVDDVTTLTFGFLNPSDNQFREGESSIIGADFFLKKIWTGFQSWVSYSYTRTENTFTGLNNDESFPGSWNIEHTFRWTGIASIKSWEFSLGWIGHSGKSFTDVRETEGLEGPVQVFFDAINANNLPNYHRLDFSVLYEFSSKKYDQLRYRLGLSVLNLYNRQNLLNREFRTTPTLENELIETNVYSLGITPNLVFRVYWN